MMTPTSNNHTIPSCFVEQDYSFPSVGIESSPYLSEAFVVVKLLEPALLEYCCLRLSDPLFPIPLPLQLLLLAISPNPKILKTQKQKQKNLKLTKRPTTSKKFEQKKTCTDSSQPP